MKKGFAELNGTKSYYEMDGSGVPLVLVHAGIADSRMWNDQFPVFAEKYQVIRYDRRGFGKTKMVAGDFSFHNDLYELLKYLEIEQAILVGCSQGGKTVIDFTLEHPEMTKTLVLVGSALSGFQFDGESPKQEEELEKADQAGDLERVNELEIQIWVDGQGRTPDQVDPKVRELVKDMNLIALQDPQDLGNEIPLEPPAAGRLSEIKVRTLVVIGDLDTAWAQAASDFLGKNIPGAKKVTMTGVAHLPNMEKPEEFNRHVLSFLSKFK
jgi:2-hydroxy-6-oxonona-2,4-dienedioate hydrolase